MPQANQLVAAHLGVCSTSSATARRRFAPGSTTFPVRHGRSGGQPGSGQRREHRRRAVDRRERRQHRGVPGVATAGRRRGRLRVRHDVLAASSTSRNCLSDFGAVDHPQQDRSEPEAAVLNQTNIGISHELMRGVSRDRSSGIRTDGKNIQATAQNHNAAVVSATHRLRQQPELHARSRCTARSTATRSRCMTSPQPRSRDGEELRCSPNPNLTSTYNGFDVGINARLPRGGARLRRDDDGADARPTTATRRVYNPNLLLYCDRAISAAATAFRGRRSSSCRARIRCRGSASS